MRMKWENWSDETFIEALESRGYILERPKSLLRVRENLRRVLELLEEKQGQLDTCVSITEDILEEFSPTFAQARDKEIGKLRFDLNIRTRIFSPYCSIHGKLVYDTASNHFFCSQCPLNVPETIIKEYECQLDSLLAKGAISNES